MEEDEYYDENYNEEPNYHTYGYCPPAERDEWYQQDEEES